MDKIKELTKSEYSQLLKDTFRNEEAKPLGLFYVKTNDGYVAIDNTTGYCHVNDVDTIEEVREWLDSRVADNQ